MRAFLDSFSGAVADLKPREKKDPMKVLAVLAEHPRLSTWDMETVWKTIFGLRDRGLVVEDKREEYPWVRYDVTDAGRAALACQCKVE